MAKYYTIETLEEFIVHLEDNAIENVTFKDAQKLIKEGKGVRSACVRRLISHAGAKSMLLWFRDHDLQQFKEWCYVTSKLRIELFNMVESNYSFMDLLWALMSDNPDIHNWYKKDAEILYKEYDKSASFPRNHQFRAKQALLALRGEWQELEERALRAMKPDSGHPRRYLVDERFFLALARGNQPDMEAALEELCSEKVRNQRNPYTGGGNTTSESGITFFCMSSYATIYAKIAWIHGFQVDIDSPYIPKEWLPVEPLDHYEDPYDFMKDISLKPVLQTG